MAGWNGSGTFVRAHNWVTDKGNAVPITASRMDAEFDNFKTGLENCLTLDGQNSPSADIALGSQKFTTVGNAAARNQFAAAGQVQDGSLCYGTGAGAGNAFTLTLSPAITAYAGGQMFWFFSNHATTGAVTIDINSVGVVAIRDVGGTALASGAIANAQLVVIVYDATNGYFRMVSPHALYALTSALSDYIANALLTTRGDLIRRGASAPERVGLGADNTVLASDGTDAAWETLTSLLDAIFSSTQGTILYRGAAAWAALGVGTDGEFLQTQGAGANPQWASLSPGLVPLQRINSSAVASYDFTTGITSTYRTYKLIGWLRPATDDVELWLRLDANAGASFDAGASDYKYGASGTVSTSPNDVTSAGDTKIIVGGQAGAAGRGVGNVASEAVQIEITISNPSDAAYKTLVNYQSVCYCAGDYQGTLVGGGFRDNAQADDAIQLLFESGNIAAGDVTLYGVVNT